MYVPDQEEDLASKKQWGCGCVFMLLALGGLGYWLIMWLATQTS